MQVIPDRCNTWRKSFRKASRISLSRRPNRTLQLWRGVHITDAAPQAQCMSHIDITIKRASALLHWSICLVGFRGVYEMYFLHTGYIQTELMTCCLGRKYKHFVLYWKIFNSYISMFQWIMKQLTIFKNRSILLVESVIWKILIVTKL